VSQISEILSQAVRVGVTDKYKFVDILIWIIWYIYTYSFSKIDVVCITNYIRCVCIIGFNNFFFVHFV
jgi:hypothetical protein